MKHVARQKISIWFEIKYDFYFYSFLPLMKVRHENQRTLFRSYQHFNIDDHSEGKKQLYSAIAKKNVIKISTILLSFQDPPP